MESDNQPDTSQITQGPLLKSDFLAKLYVLDDDDQWVDKGTGHVKFVEYPNEQ